MSLQTNLSAAFTQIGTDIKGINTRLTSLESFGTADVQNMIDAAIAALINGAPTTYDTLKEIADYLAANDGVLASLSTLIGSKVAQVDFDALVAALGDLNTDFLAVYKAARDAV